MPIVRLDQKKDLILEKYKGNLTNKNRGAHRG